MRIYEKLRKARNEINNYEDPYQRRVFGSLLTKLVVEAFKNNDELPKRFEILAENHIEEEVEILLDKILDLKVKSVEKQVTMFNVNRKEDCKYIVELI